MKRRDQEKTSRRREGDKQNLIILKPSEQYIGNRVHKYLCDNKRNITAQLKRKWF